MLNDPRATLFVVALVALCGGLARAADEPVDAKMLLLRDAGPNRRQVQLRARDVDSVGGIVNFSEADDPTSHGASLHVFSATDDFCSIFVAANWQNRGTKLKYRDASRNRAIEGGPSAHGETKPARQHKWAIIKYRRESAC